jgi:pSer/pThr/pTyr-binding forkhead associated (FHA) protein
VPESVLTILKFCFLALLYLFLYRVVRVVVNEMKAPVPSAPPEPARAKAVAAPTDRARGRGPHQLKILEPAGRRGETFTLQDELTVGRGGGCGIVLDDTFVSQVHARVFRRDGEVWVEDLGSRNGTLVNGQPLDGARRLRRGDTVQFGKTVAEATR